MPASAAPGDEDLMLAYAAGDAAAFDTLYARHKGGVYRYLLRQCRQGGVADELFQDVWMNLIRARASYVPSAKFTTWLYRLAHNRLIDYYRASGQVSLVSADDEAHADTVAALPAQAGDQPERRTENHELGARLKDAVAALPFVQREAFLLHQEGGLSLAEIAELTGVGVETVKSRLRYATNKLRVELSDLYEPRTMSEVDDKLDAAWRGASREGPPAALDDAIRAAARRAVGAGPSRARHMRSWPLAAAAVVTVLAIGIVQLTPPEQVTPTIVADSASRLDALKEQHTTTAGRTGDRRHGNAGGTTASCGDARRRWTAQTVCRASRLRNRHPLHRPCLPTSSAVGAEGCRQRRQCEMTATRDRDAAQAKSKSENAAPEASAKKERAEPFPAGSAEAKVAANVPDASPSPPTAPLPRAGPPRHARAQPRSLQHGRDPSEADARAPALLAKATPESERAKDSAPRTPDEWIKLIRRLQSEGRKDDVAKELAAFRAEYKERADALLPADLREIEVGVSEVLHRRHPSPLAPLPV